MTFNSYSRENSIPNQYRYNGKELQDELDLGWLDYGARMYDQALGRWCVIDPKEDLLEMSSPYVYSINSPVNFIDKDGELPIFINGRVNNDSERGSSKYWDVQLLRTIASSGIPNPGGTIKFVDGDRGTYPNLNEPDGREFNNLNSVSSSSRRWAKEKAGREDFKKILAQLAKDAKTGKITEKIQIYTHSRGAAFDEGYTKFLLEMIKENHDLFEDANNVIDFVYNMALYQSGHLAAPEGVDS